MLVDDVDKLLDVTSRMRGELETIMLCDCWESDRI